MDEILRSNEAEGQEGDKAVYADRDKIQMKSRKNNARVRGVRVEYYTTER
jgi:hypothetical protein